MTDNTPVRTFEVDRRSLVRAAGWSLPVISAVAAAPLAAASTSSGAVLSLSGGCVRFDADNPYGPGFEVMNVGTEPFDGSLGFQDFMTFDASVPTTVDQVINWQLRQTNMYQLGSGLTVFYWGNVTPARLVQRTIVFNGTLGPGSRIAWGCRSKTLAEISGYPDWLPGIQYYTLVRSADPVPQGIAVDAKAIVNWSDLTGQCG